MSFVGVNEVQHAILQMMEHVRPLLKTKTPSSGQGPKQYVKGWRTAPPFFSEGGEWGYGASLLYPAGFQQGQRVCRDSSERRERSLLILKLFSGQRAGYVLLFIWTGMSSNGRREGRLVFQISEMM